ncbi:Translational repressor [Malassezia nana]|uniref:Translational repressor n=1 Tax=Malassezia nana TaxID=180528 RepID=A0AAF0ESQ8_9BASI|nr:Translational repressor [Malassezia nana]
MTALPDGARAPGSGAGMSRDDARRAQHINFSQEQLLHAQLEQLGLDPSEDDPSPARTWAPTPGDCTTTWSSASTWAPGPLDTLEVPSRPWDAPAPPVGGASSARGLPPHRAGDMNPSFRFPSSQPTYVASNTHTPTPNDVEQQRQAIQQQIEQLQRQQEQLQWQQQLLLPHAAPHRPADRGAVFDAVPGGAAWPSQRYLHRVTSSESAPGRRLPPSFQPAPATDGSGSGMPPLHLRKPTHTRHASYQLVSELSPQFLMAGGGLLNLATLGVGGGWGELADDFPDAPTERESGSGARHMRSSSTSAAQWRVPTQEDLLAGLPQAQAQLAALHRSRQQIAPAMHGRAMSHGRSASMGGGAPRRALFGSYLPQSSLPLLLLAGKLVVGVLRINKRNRSDAWVSTEVLGHDIFISGSKDRNRALEGDLVAVELLDPQEVWQTKREKVDKKKRKEESSGTAAPSALAAPVGGRRPDKARDDMEVEGAQLTLIEDEEESELSPPALAGHVVAIVERMPGQIFPGTLALLRPSSVATKEKQQAERHANSATAAPQDDDAAGTPRPKIVWFRPSDKRVPLIAIPADQAPDDFWDERQQEMYSRCLFVACIKRWPITSLHPFGALVDRLGPIGSRDAESQALLRANCQSHTTPFSDAALLSVPGNAWTLPATEQHRPSFTVFTLDGRGPPELAFSIEARGNELVLGVHAADVAHFVKSGSALDREARRRGASVALVERVYDMLPPGLLAQAALHTGREALAQSVVWTVERGTVTKLWIGRSLVLVAAQVPLEALDAAFDHASSESVLMALPSAQTLLSRWRSERVARGALLLRRTSLDFVMAPDGAPTSCQVRTDGGRGRDLLDELCVRANTAVAHRLVAALPDTALLLRQEPPNERALSELSMHLRPLGVETARMTSAQLPHAVQGLPAAAWPVAEALLVQALPPPKLFAPGLVDMAHFDHYSLAEPLYTQFTSPLQRFADVQVHRQLDAVCQGGPVEQDAEAIAKLAQQCNVKLRAASRAESQSQHLYLCDLLARVSKEELVPHEAVVIAVRETSFDVRVPSLAVEKRVHLDCLPIDEAPWDAASRTLTLRWRANTHPLAWLAQAIDDAACARLWDMHSARLAPVKATTQRIAPLERLDVYVLADMEKSPPILKVVPVPAP